MWLSFIFIFTLCQFFCFSKITLADEVLRKIKKKKVVIVNRGAKAGYEKGARVCFFSKKNTRIACGEVKRVKKRKSFVKVKNHRFRKVRKGMQARLMEGRGVAYHNSINIRGFFLFTPMTPTSYQLLTFKTPESGETPSTVWESQGQASQSNSGFGLEFEMPIAGFGIAAGFRIRNFESYKYLSDYSSDTSESNLYVTVFQSSYEQGFWVHAKVIELNVGLPVSLYTGIDIDMHTVNLEISQDSDEGDSFEIFTGSSALTVISLTVAPLINFSMGSFGIFALPKIYLPLNTSGGIPVGNDITDEKIVDTVDDPNGDLEVSLAHTKNSIGLELAFGAMYSF